MTRLQRRTRSSRKLKADRVAIDVKICGITDPDAMRTSIHYGADLVGLVFFPPSPRDIRPSDAAQLAAMVPENITRVGLFVDPEDGFLESVLASVPLDAIQLHGDEPPERCSALHSRTGRAIFKAIKVRNPADLDQAERYAQTCQRLLFDAKPPAEATRPGGNAEAFDWTLLEGRSWPVPWLLAGGLTAENVKTGIRVTGCPGVDVSSGVESGTGKKDPEKIRRFLTAAKSL